MRTRKRKIGLFVAVSIMAVGLLTPTAMTQVYTEPVGFVRVDVVRDGLSLISVPLMPGDKALNGVAGCVGDMIKENLTGGGAEIASDRILKWDRGAEDYVRAFLVETGGALPDLDGKWIDPTLLTLPDPLDWLSDMTLDTGEAFWLERKGEGEPTEEIVFLGWVNTSATTSLTLGKGLSMFSWPYPTTLALNDSTLGLVAMGSGAEISADRVLQWDPALGDYVRAFLVDTGGALPDLDGKWIDPTLLTLPDPNDWVSDMAFAPGVGCWFDRKPDDAISWVTERPFE